jgi:disulfide bond formation protein DsbB
MTEIFSRIALRQWGALFFAASAAVLAAVFISQNFGFHPCKLCIWQRIPYAIVFVLAGILFFTRARFILLLIAAACLFNAGLAFFHLGVEYKWWTFASDCVGNNAFKAGASVEEMMAALQRAPIMRCDQREIFLFGMTMAFYNILTSAVMGIVALFAYQRSNSLSQ